MTEEASKIQEFINSYLDQGDVIGWFEALYARAEGNLEAVPWAHRCARVELVEWFFEQQPAATGKRALVVGCGLGDDAEFLAGLGFAVTAFDISQTAIEWCKKRFPESKVEYVTADMFAPPPAWLQAFDFVLEVYIVQALPPQMRRQSIKAVADFVAPDGTLLCIGRGMEQCEHRGGPPWALFPQELALFEEEGLRSVQFDRKDDDAIAPEYRYRAEYVRPAAPSGESNG